MARIRVLRFISAATLVAVILAARTSPAVELEDEEYAVFAAVLGSSRWRFDERPFLIVGETADAAHTRDFDATMNYVRTNFTRQDSSILVTDEVVTAFRFVHAARSRLDPNNLSVRNGTIVAPSEPRPFQGNVVTLSRVGFDSARTQALVSLSYYCGPLCGAGLYIFIEKRDGQWQLRAVTGLWIS